LFEKLGVVVETNELLSPLPSVDNSKLYKEYSVLSNLLIRATELAKNPDQVSLRGLYSRTNTPEVRALKEKRAFDLMVLRWRWDREKPANFPRPGSWKTHFDVKDPTTNRVQMRSAQEYLNFYLASIVREMQDRQTISLYLNDLAKIISEKMQSEPAPFYETASSWVKTRLRRGPKSKTRSGKERSNFYLPFGYFKSKKFLADRTDLSETLKMKLSSITEKCNVLVEKVSLDDILTSPDDSNSFIKGLYLASDESQRRLKEMDQSAENILTSFKNTGSSCKTVLGYFNPELLESTLLDRLTSSVDRLPT
jgi:hypothetical protein